MPTASRRYFYVETPNLQLSDFVVDLRRLLYNKSATKISIPQQTNPQQTKSCTISPQQIQAMEFAS